MTTLLTSDNGYTKDGSPEHRQSMAHVVAVLEASHSGDKEALHTLCETMTPADYAVAVGLLEVQTRLLIRAHPFQTYANWLANMRRGINALLAKV